MGKIFDIEGPFMSGLTKFADIIIVNILFLLCSIPVITVGASATAMYYITLKMAKNEECYIVKGFFKSFKQNFLQATAIWILTLIVGVILYVDFKIMSGQFGDVVNVSSGFSKVMLVVLLAASIFYLFVVSFVFPQLAKFDNTIKNTIRNAFLMSIGHFPSAIAIVAISIIPVFIIFLVPSLSIFIFIIFGLIAYCNSFLFVRIYKRYIPENEVTDDIEFSVNMEGKAEDSTQDNTAAIATDNTTENILENTGSADEK